jgi:hypothetical protein
MAVLSAPSFHVSYANTRTRCRVRRLDKVCREELVSQKAARVVPGDRASREGRKSKDFSYATCRGSALFATMSRYFPDDDLKSHFINASPYIRGVSACTSSCRASFYIRLMYSPGHDLNDLSPSR